MKKILLLSLMTISASSAFAEQICNDKIDATTPNSRFTIHADSTVTDKATGLIWMRCTLGESGENCTSGTPIKLNWSQTLQTAENTVFAGKSDWRLPNYKELSSITETSCYSPAINQTVFPNTKNIWYLSSTPSNYCPNCIWSVYFKSGIGHRGYTKKLDNHLIRLVREAK